MSTTQQPQQLAEPANKARRVIPLNDLDMSYMTTNSVWGQSEVSEDLRNKLSRLEFVKDEKGNIVRDEDGNPVAVYKDSLWGLLAFYTRDMRLANLSTWNGEVEYCQYHIDLAGDLLQSDMIGAFLVALSRAATILELSQSKGGFLRRKQNTFTQENVSKDESQQKKSLFGMGGKKK